MCRPYLIDVHEGKDLISGLMGFLKDKPRMPQPQVSAHEPYAPVYTGDCRKVIGGRTVVYHIPEQFEVSGAGLFLFLDNGQTCDDFLKSNAWKAFRQTQEVVTILLEPLPEGWSKQQIAQEIKFAKAVFTDAIGRDDFSLNEATYYVFGQGAGAYPAAAFSLLYASVLSGFAVDGDAALHPDLLAQLAALPSDGDRHIPHALVALPAWLIDREGSMDALLAYLRRANNIKTCGHKTLHYTTYQPCIQACYASVNALPCVQLYHSDAAQAAQLPPFPLQQVLSFLLQHKRWLDEKNGSFRPARSAQDMGLCRYEMQHAGRLRHWYVSAPPDVGESPLPLVLALHGYSCTGKLFAENSGWHEVGAARGFLVIYPTAYPCSMNGCTPLPLWNCNQFPGEQGINDVAFLLDVLKDVKKHYPVDESRMYVAGHSNGSAMTQQLMLATGHTFAAFAPVGFTYGEALQPDRQDITPVPPHDDMQRPVWLIKGEYDIGCAARLEDGNANDQFLRTMRKINQAVGDAAQQCFGIYENTTWFDTAGAPVVRFTKARGMPHAYTPEMAWLTWDLFFSRFSRGDNGEIQYRRF